MSECIYNLFLERNVENSTKTYIYIKCWDFLFNFHCALQQQKLKSRCLNFVCLPYAQSYTIWQPFYSAQGYDCFRKSDESQMRCYFLDFYCVHGSRDSAVSTESGCKMDDWRVKVESWYFKNFLFSKSSRLGPTQSPVQWVLRTSLDTVEKRKFLTLLGLKLWSLDHLACSQSLYRLLYPGSCIITETLLNDHLHLFK
jgi:hypothetical protein